MLIVTGAIFPGFEMKNIKLIIPAIALICLFSGCSFIGNVFKYRDTTKEFVEALVHEDYNKCTSLMDLQGVNSQYLDTIRKSLKLVHQSLVVNFGNKLDYSFETAQKTFSTNISTNNGGQTVLLMQIANQKDFGEIQVTFNDKSQKIFNFNVLDVKQRVPDLTLFWLFGILPLCILAFNIYVLIAVKRSNVTYKWIKYLVIILVNVPTIGYKAIGGIFYKVIDIQVLFGVSFSFTGYMNSIWGFGIPLGGLCVLFMLKMNYFKTKTDKPLKKGKR